MTTAALFVDLALPLKCRPAPVELPHRFPPGGRPVFRRFVIMGKGKHRRPSLRERLTRYQPNLGVRATVAWVDLCTGVTHLLTPDAAAAGRVRAGRYIVLCGAEVIPAAMTESGVEQLLDRIRERKAATSTRLSIEEILEHRDADRR